MQDYTVCFKRRLSVLYPNSGSVGLLFISHFTFIRIIKVRTSIPLFSTESSPCQTHQLLRENENRPTADNLWRLEGVRSVRKIKGTSFNFETVLTVQRLTRLCFLWLDLRMFSRDKTEHSSDAETLSDITPPPSTDIAVSGVTKYVSFR